MKKTTLQERLYSESNLYLAAYLAPSYIFNEELLSDADRKTLRMLKDAYNEGVYSRIMRRVEGRLQKIMNDPDDYFHTEVYFKPKSFRETENGNGEGSMVFRPLHTASLVDQIAMVAMLQLLVYDVQEDNTLVPSELSRLMPGNFYGNRIASDGRNLFKPWKEQYHAYTSRANELTYLYCDSGKYRFAIELDLKNFFPSVNPWLVYRLMTEKMSLHYSPEDQEIYRTILRKLLIFKLATPLNAQESQWYCEDLDHCTYAKGIPQGLPHSYFMANFLMIQIQKIYQAELPGDMLFYVDDSVIFTNAIEDQSELEGKIERINKQLKELSKNIHPSFALPEWEYEQDSLIISVHGIQDRKISCIRLTRDNMPPDKVYLRGICRETSGISFDIHSIAAEEDIQAVLNRIKEILVVIEKEIQRVGKEKERAAKEAASIDDLKLANAESYLKKLTRYHKFFSNRKLLLSRLSESKYEEFRALFVKAVDSICGEMSMTEQAMEKYNQNDMVMLIRSVYQYRNLYGDEETKEADRKYALLVKLIYDQNIQHAYLEKVKAYGRALGKQLEEVEPAYVSLKQAVQRKYPMLRHTPVHERMKALKSIIYAEGEARDSEPDETARIHALAGELGFSNTFRWNVLVRSMNDAHVRQLLNAVASVILGYAPGDSLQLCNQKVEPMQYAEIRVFAWLRNRQFSLLPFLARFDDMCSEAYAVEADYAILKVLRYFRQYAGRPKRVDELICIHKVCCDTWKNGSKYLYFYTLHNQEHAIQLIETIIQLCSRISELRIKRIDFFLLFAACYLHDISMVSMPDFSDFCMDTGSLKAEEIYTRYVTRQNAKDSTAGKRQLVELYQEMEGYFEQQIRGPHPATSAQAIRTWKELDFLDRTDREMIAQISEAHGYDCEDIYRMKAKATDELVSMKADCILLRLADVLDMCKYRVSMLLLDHNIESMNPVSRFHWLSHLLTKQVRITSNYALKEGLPEEKTVYVQNGIITQEIDIRIDLLFDQQTPTREKGDCIVQRSKQSDSGEIRLVCGGTRPCDQKQCPFVCRWFFTKNNYLLPEINELASYLNRLPNQFYRTQVSIVLSPVQPNQLTNKQFGYVVDFVKG